MSCLGNFAFQGMHNNKKQAVNASPYHLLIVTGFRKFPRDIFSAEQFWSVKWNDVTIHSGSFVHLWDTWTVFWSDKGNDVTSHSVPLIKFLWMHVGEGWWLHDQLAEWRWHKEGLWWQERVGGRSVLKLAFVQDIYELDLRRIALTANVSYIIYFFLFAMLGFRVAGQVPEELLERICQFWAHIGTGIVWALWSNTKKCVLYASSMHWMKTRRNCVNEEWMRCWLEEWMKGKGCMLLQALEAARANAGWKSGWKEMGACCYRHWKLQEWMRSGCDAGWKSGWKEMGACCYRRWKLQEWMRSGCDAGWKSGWRKSKADVWSLAATLAAQGWWRPRRPPCSQRLRRSSFSAKLLMRAWSRPHCQGLLVQSPQIFLEFWIAWVFSFCRLSKNRSSNQIPKRQ